MTRPQRRDKDVKNASVIAGLRLEPALALKLTAYTLKHVTRDKRGRADVAEATRYLLHRSLGADHDTAELLGHGPHSSATVPGLRLGRETVEMLKRLRGERFGLNRAATIRHLLRLQLGWTRDASMEVEEKFAAIADARRALMDVSR